MKADVKRYGVYLLLCLLSIALALSVMPGSPLKLGVVGVMERLRTVPPVAGAALLSLLQIGAVVLALPATPFNLAAGYLFTVWLGSAVSLTSMYTGAAVAFLVGRFLARSWVEEQIERRPAFRSIDMALSANGFSIVFLVMLTPLFPAGLSCYFFGITNVGLARFLLGVALGLAPGTLALTYLGSLMGDLRDAVKDSPGPEAFSQSLVWIGAAVVATLAVLGLLGAATRRTLQQMVPPAELGRGPKDREDRELSCIVDCNP